MALTGPPLVEQSGSHSGAKFRQFLETLLPQPGVGGSLDCQVKQRVTPGQGALVSTGGIWLLGTSNAVQGHYFDFNDADVDVPAPAADGAQARIDRLVYRVRDPDFQPGTPPSAFEWVTGTAGSGTPPSLPSDAVSLAQVNRPAANNTITNAQITDERKFAAAVGGVIPCTSGSRPTNRPAGQLIYESDTGAVLVWDGAVWRNPVARSTAALYKARAYRAATITLGGGLNVFPFDSVDYDTGASITTGASFHFTVPYAGWYDVRWHLKLVPTGGNVGISHFLYANGSQLRRLGDQIEIGSPTYAYSGFAGTARVQLAAGANLDLHVLTGAGQNMQYMQDGGTAADSPCWIECWYIGS